MRTWFIAGTAEGLASDLVTAADTLGDRVTVATDEPGWRNTLSAHRGRIHIASGFDADPAAAMQAIVNALGRIDVVVIIIDHEMSMLVTEVNETQIGEVFRANLAGPLRVVNAVLPSMYRQRGGHVIFLSAIGKGSADGLYEASRAALRAMADALHKESESYGVAASFLEHARLAPATPAAHPDRPQGGLNLDRHRYRDGPAIAAAVLEVAGAVEPPMFLPLGSDAVRRVETRAARRAEELATWRDIAELARR